MPKIVGRSRHWRQRFTPGAQLVWRKPTLVDGVAYEPGETVPEGFSRRMIKRWWSAHRIELAIFERPPMTRLASERIAAIVTAIGGLDPTDPGCWIKSGAPSVTALEAALGYQIDQTERNEAWAVYQAQQDA